MKTYQINNLTIKYVKAIRGWNVLTPDKRVWDTFRRLPDAITYCETVSDFLTPIGFQRKFGIKPRS